METKDIKALADTIEGVAGEWGDLKKELADNRKKYDEKLASTGEQNRELISKHAELAERIDAKEKQLDEVVEKIAQVSALQKQLDEMDAAMQRGGGHLVGAERQKSIGELVTSSERFPELAKMRQGDTRAIFPVEGRSILPPRSKTLLTSTASDNLIVPFEAGLVAALERRLRLRDLMQVNQTQKDAIRYIRETGFYGSGDTGVSITGITRSSQTATATTAAAHGLRDGQEVVVAGADQAEYNIRAKIDVTGATTFTYTVSGSPATPATGTITYTVPRSHGAAATWESDNTKAEATLTLDEVLAEVRTIAHWIPATRQVLDDAPQVRAYVDNRLLYGLLFEEERQILYGSGSPPDLEGLLVVDGRQTYTQAGNDDVVAALLQAQVLAAVNEFEASGIVVSWAKWKSVIDARVNAGTDDRFIHGSPVGRGSGPRDIDGVPVLVTNAINDTDALVGDFQMGASLWDRESGMVRVSDSHSDYFVKNKLAILAEERVALAIYRPDAFVHVTLS